MTEIDEALAWADDQPGLSSCGWVLAQAYREEKALREKAEVSVKESEKRLSDAVPRSRYNVCCDQYNEAEAARKKALTELRASIEREAKLREALAHARYRIHDWSEACSGCNPAALSNHPAAEEGK